MKSNRTITLCFAFTAIAAFAQTKPAFEVATIKPSPPPDMAKLRALVQAGGKLPFGPKVDSGRAEYTGMDLKSLIALAYGVKPDEIAGPDWMEDAPFDIVAKLPEGAAKDDAPKMLQSLLEERFHLTVHRTSAERSVLALIVGKSGLKMKPSAQTPEPPDESAPPKPGETSMDVGSGVRMLMNAATGATVIDMGQNGRISLKLNTATRAMHMDFSMVTMGGLADWLKVVDMTGLKGNYDASVDEALPDASSSDLASDPVGGPSARKLNEAQALGLKLESRKALVEQLVIDHVEKTPTAN